MRVKRSKQYRKLMQQYQLHFAFREPYQVLLDAQFIRDSSRYRMNLGSNLQSVLQSNQIKPLITQCCIRHLYNIITSTEAEKREKESWIEAAKAAERRRCGHHELEEPLSTLECLESVVDPKGSGKNKHRYIIASQDEEVRRRMRRVAGVPLVYINRSVMILEPMAQATLAVRESEERGKVRAGLKGRRGAAGSEMKRKREEDEDAEALNDAQEALADGEPAPKKKKVRGPKGPNPLSVKKAKSENEKRSTAKQVEDERAILRKATKMDPQAGEKALDAEAVATSAPGDGVMEGSRKRKRKRKGKQTTGGDYALSSD